MFDNDIALRPDVAVIGAGPAGLSLAAELARRGLRVTCVAPRLEEPWHQCFGAYVRDLEGTPALAAIEALWHRPFVQIDHRDRFNLPFAYARLDTDSLQDDLRHRATAAGVTLVDGRVEGLTNADAVSRLQLRDGRRLTARLVVDASGARSSFTQRSGRGAEPGFQSAYGELVRLKADHGYADDEMALMDFRGDEPGPPTFLYALPLGRREIFVEETVLVGRPPTPHTLLRGRLHRRLARMGLEVDHVHARELCTIPMGGPLPFRNQPVVAYGAAAGMVHPATGYQIARALRFAPRTAEAIAEGLEGSPAQAARNAYATIWPDADLRTWELYRFGMEVLVDLDQEGVRRFMRAFFRLAPDRWFAFMTGAAPPREVVSSMWQVFGHADTALRSKLLWMGAGRGSQSLLRAALPNNPL